MQSSNRHQLRRTSPSGRSSRSNFADNRSTASQGSMGSRCNALQRSRHMLRHSGSCSLRYRLGSGSRPRSSCRTHTSPLAAAAAVGWGGAAAVSCSTSGTGQSRMRSIRWKSRLSLLGTQTGRDCPVAVRTPCLAGRRRKAVQRPPSLANPPLQVRLVPHRRSEGLGRWVST